MKKYSFWIFPLLSGALTVAGLYFYREIRCLGAYGDIMIFFLLLIAGLIIILIQIILLVIWKKLDSEIKTLLVTICIPGIIIVIKALWPEPKTVIYAEFLSKYEYGLEDNSIKFLKDSSYIISMVHVELGCKYGGKYQIKQDTFFLEDDVVIKTDSNFYSKYLLQDNKYLIPLDIHNDQQDSSFWLRILKMEK